MKRKDYYDLRKGILASQHVKGAAFQYAMAKNLKILNEEISSMEESIKPSEEYQKYDKERVELLKEHAQLDEKGNFLLDANNAATFESVEKAEAYAEKINKIRNKKEYKDIITEHEKKTEDFNKFINQELKEKDKPNFVYLEKEDLPDEIGGELLLLEPFLK